MRYPISEMFRSLQGEGHFVGYPMTFVRFAGCSLWGSRACAIWEHCDTEPTELAERLNASQVVSRVREFAADGIVVLTGGEPADHDLIPIVSALRDASYRVHVETSGQSQIFGLPVEWITVSPKAPDYQQRVGHTLKIVVRPGWSWADVRRLDEGTSFLHRYLQPLTINGCPVNLLEVSAMVIGQDNQNARWALSTQAHRTWGLP